MKKIINLLLVVTILSSFVACKKDPKNVVLTSDKTTITRGEKANFTVTVDNATWVALFRKEPGASSFTEYGGSSTAPYYQSFSTDTTTATGVYTFYIEARNCGKGNTESGKKCKLTNSNEVSVTVTP